MVHSQDRSSTCPSATHRPPERALAGQASLPIRCHNEQELLDLRQVPVGVRQTDSGEEGRAAADISFRRSEVDDPPKSTITAGVHGYRTFRKSTTVMYHRRRFTTFFPIILSGRILWTVRFILLISPRHSPCWGCMIRRRIPRE